MYISGPNLSEVKGSASTRTVVVGAGTVGLYLASLLVARGRRVVVIESGDSHLGNFESNAYQSIGHRHRGIATGRGRNVGGTSSLWGGQLVEFQPADFVRRDGVPGSGWPIDYSEVAPYYKPTYLNLGIPAAVLNDDDVLKGVGAEELDLGPDLELFLTRWMRTPNFSQLFAKQIETDDKLLVLTNCTAIGFRGNGSRIEAVHVVGSKGESEWIEADTFVLAAGTFENARLLLAGAEDSGWPAPWRENQNVGRYFQDHLGARMGVFHPADKGKFFKSFANIVYGKSKFQPKIRMNSQALMRRQTFNMQGIFAFEGEASEHIVFLKQFLRAALYSGKIAGVGDVMRKGFGLVRFLLPMMWKYTLEHRIFVPSTAKTVLLLQGEQAPCADSRITLDTTVKDSYGLPRAVLDWGICGDELAAIRDFAVMIRESLLEAGLGELKIDEDLLAMNPRFLDTVDDTRHPAGGAVMGRSERDGVVDANLRVFSTENLYIGGASVFPTSSSANITFTALTLTTRLADHLTGVSSLPDSALAAAAVR